MKNLLPFILSVFILVSCKKDDDVTVPICSEPTNIQATSITQNTAVLTWDDANASATFVIEYGLSGFSIGTGTIVNINTNNISLSGLDANTSYDVYLQSVCSVSNLSMQSQVFSFNTLPPLVNPQFLANLSDLNIFSGDLADLIPSIYTFEYDLVTPLFTDYAHKQRLIALPPDTSMHFIDNGFPEFPNGTLIAKTFYYNEDDRDESLGRTIIETRVLIKTNNEWELGNYTWNVAQTEAVLTTESALVPISFIDEDGETKNVDYVIPSASDCFTCHSNAGNETPIGPKLRTMNMNDQLQNLIDMQYLTGISDVSSIEQLPDWENTSYSREERSRAYFDVNCAHCHSDGGFCETQSSLRLLWETPFDDTNIYTQRFSIINRMQTYQQGFSMPYIGTTFIHAEGFELIQSYLNGL